jgi:hypothetical protein
MAIGLNERSNTYIDIISRNLRGFSEEKEDEIILRMMQRSLWLCGDPARDLADRRQHVGG